MALSSTKNKDSRTPIFIVGCPRSGTTVLASLLNRHSQIASTTETHFFNHVAQLAVFKEAIDEGFSEDRITSIYEDARVKDFCEVSEISKGELVQALLSLKGPGKKDIFNCFMKLFLAKRKKPRYLEKTPQHLLNVNELLGYYPQAKIIYLIRDGRDCVNSLLKMPWRPPGLVNNARFWLQYTKLGTELEKKFSDSILSIKYEDLLREPKLSLEKICEFVEEDFELEMLNHEDSSSIFASWEDDWKSKANQKLDATRIGAWETELNETDKILLNKVLYPRLKELKYLENTHKYQAKFIHNCLLCIEYFKLVLKKLLRPIITG